MVSHLMEMPLNQELSSFAIDQRPISFKQILQWLRSSGRLPTFLQEILSQYVIEQELQQRTDLEIDRARVQQTIAHFRQMNGLEEPQQFQDWLFQQGWDGEIFQQQIQFNLKLEAFKAQLAAPKLLECFMEHKVNLDRVVLSRIVVKSQDLAEELKLQLEEGASFAQLAQEYSQAEDAITNGMMGVVSRSDAYSWFGVDVYQFQPGQLIEPIACGQGWCLLRVEKLLPAELEGEIKNYLQEQIFQQWLTQKIQMRTVDLNLSHIY